MRKFNLEASLQSSNDFGMFATSKIVLLKIYLFEWLRCLKACVPNFLYFLLYVLAILKKDKLVSGSEIFCPMFELNHFNTFTNL